MAFNDDDEIKNLVSEDVSADENWETIAQGKTQATERISWKTINSSEAPMEKTRFKVMVELTGSGSGKDRPGLDLVTVLDVSRYLTKDMLDKMKIAMEFVINKLSPIDRLSVVKVNHTVTRICRLRQMTPESKEEIKRQVNGFVSESFTNMAKGLEMALAVLAARRFTTGRTAAIMLMSCQQMTSVDFNNDVPVFTFGANHIARVLQGITLVSGGGTFSDIQKSHDLNYAFAQCLAGLLTVGVENLELTLKPINSTFGKVCAGNYKQVTNNGGSVTISFGNLYIKEVRKVIVELCLPAATSRLSADILEIAYKYKSLEESGPFKAAPIFVRVRRNGNAVVSNPPSLTCEVSRITTYKMMEEARILADQNKLDEAWNKLAEAQNKLANVSIDDDNESNKTLEMMKYEVSQFMDNVLKKPLTVVYKRQVLPFALSSETSHERQRYATRGDVGYLRLFSTPRMSKYVEQMKAFMEDPTKSVPSEKEDVNEELAADPLASIAGALSYHIQNAIQSLQAIDKILKKPLNA